MAKRVLISWIGRSDFGAVKTKKENDFGPVLRLLKAETFDEIYLLNDIEEAYFKHINVTTTKHEYIEWLKARVAEISPEAVIHPLRDAPMRLQSKYAEAYEFTRDQINQIRRSCFERELRPRFAFLLTPGYPVCQISMLAASCSLFDYDEVEMFNTLSPLDTSQGTDLVERVELPFSIAIDFLRVHAIDGHIDLPQDGKHSKAIDEIIGSSLPMAKVKAKAQKAADSDATVLITGPSGSGKTIVARAIHDSSSRKDGPFIEVNCGAIAEKLIESLMFGHAKGSFTGAVADHTGFLESADGGTLFLDEIGEASPLVQVKLLKAIEEKTFTRVGESKPRKSDFRLICATNRNLKSAIRKREFRDDFFWRICTITMDIPPLNERASDIDELAGHFLEDFAPTYGEKTISAEALALLRSANWEGNVRELRGLIETALVYSDREAQEVSSGLIQALIQPKVTAGKSRRLGQITPIDLLVEYAAITDLLIARYKAGTIPFQTDQLKDNFQEQILIPLLAGRIEKQTMVCPEIFSSEESAFSLVGKNTYYSTWKKFREHYEAEIGPLIDEAKVKSRK